MSWRLASLAETEDALASRHQWQACVYAESTRLKEKFRGRKELEETKPDSLPPRFYSHELYFVVARRDNVALLHRLFYSTKRGAQGEASEEAPDGGPTAEAPSGAHAKVDCHARFFVALAPREDPRDLFASTCSRLVKVNAEAKFPMELVGTRPQQGFRAILKESRKTAASLVDLFGDTPSYYFFVQESEDSPDDPRTLNFLIRLRVATHPVALPSPLADEEGEAAPPSNPVCPGEPGGASPRDAASDFLTELDILVRLLTFVRAEDNVPAREQSEDDRRIVVAVKKRAEALASAWPADASRLFVTKLGARLPR